MGNMTLRNLILSTFLISQLTFCKITLGATIEDLGILDKLLKRNYDRRATPTNHLNNTTPTKVYVELFVRSFGSPSPVTMDYKVDLFLRQKWRDERLQSPEFKRPLDLNDPNLVKAIWKPEVYFPNGKEADFQFVTVPNVLVRINPNGDILYMLRLKVTFSCMMDLSKFPLDRQICTMEVASFSKTVEELILEWNPEEPISIKGLGMSQFELQKIVPSKCHEEFQIGNYSCLVAEFHLYRLLGFHLVQSYLPTILMVVISWVSFWMDVNSVPGRVTLGITTLLTVSSKATNQGAIESSYIKALDVWMGSCTAFVFLALLEFTVVNYLWRKECSRNWQRVKAQHSCSADFMQNNHSENIGRSPSNHSMLQMKEKPLGNSIEMSVSNFVDRNDKSHYLGVVDQPVIPVEGINVVEPFASVMNCQPNYKERAKSIDETCRIVFPLSFTLFIILYWSYYLIA
ncbi:glycine receptor subunit alpha-2 isoform X2 [Folsomia candida]|uniref:glycine receptor subunit alpha-2 isoform X2 n=1 Tax=Folsomia candida TaxID=158441 RepID=UPI000B8F91B4|nr:glycine receptor subunit alpha-2 isoform X2 [Folsomia candida]